MTATSRLTVHDQLMSSGRYPYPERIDVLLDGVAARLKR
jgi:hypothetical protein